MDKEEEKKLIETTYRRMTYCDDWSIEDIEFHLRVQFMTPKALTEDEAYDYISELCYGGVNIPQNRD